MINDVTHAPGPPQPATPPPLYLDPYENPHRLNYQRDPSWRSIHDGVQSRDSRGDHRVNAMERRREVPTPSVLAADQTIANLPDDGDSSKFAKAGFTKQRMANYLKTFGVARPRFEYPHAH
jgi:hypothetical protein